MKKNEDVAKYTSLTRPLGSKIPGEMAVAVPPPHHDALLDSHIQTLVSGMADWVGHEISEWELKQQLQATVAHQQHRALHDPLTDLPNRAGFLEALQHALFTAGESGELVAVGLIDCDDFKPINDTYGHGVGDIVLKTWAERLARHFTAPHFVSRLGGDEFAWIWQGTGGSPVLEEFLDHLVDDLTAPLVIALDQDIQTQIVVHASVGITQAYARDEPQQLLRQADRALYMAKNQKAHRTVAWVWYNRPTSHISVHASHIPQGVRVEYQPIVDVRTGDVRSLEALVRLWDGHRLWNPGQFLGDLTPNEMQDLTFAVLDQILRDMTVFDQRWQTPQPLSISLNLEPSMLTAATIRRIGQTVSAAAADPQRITLELLETSDFLSHAMARHQLQVLKEKRFQLALDDVGSAYSSLLRIRELPLDTLKLDQAFVRHIPEHPDDLLFVMSIQTLARGFRAQFVAEGVETAEIWDALQVLGVDRIQGYVLTRPLALDALIAWGTRYRPFPADGRPHSLLGAYAAHVAVQPGERTGIIPGDNPHRVEYCPMTGYLDEHGWTGSELVREHWRGHEDRGSEGDRFKSLLVAALKNLGKPRAVAY